MLTIPADTPKSTLVIVAVSVTQGLSMKLKELICGPGHTYFALMYLFISQPLSFLCTKNLNAFRVPVLMNRCMS